MKFYIRRASEKSVKGIAEEVVSVPDYGKEEIGIINFESLEEMATFLKKMEHNVVIEKDNEYLEVDEDLLVIAILDDYYY